MAKSKSYDAYDQVAEPSQGGTQKAHKNSSDQCEALGNPRRFTRTTPGAATPDPDSELKATREKQLGSNGYQGN